MKWKIHRNLFDVYRMLRAANPSPYLYYFKHKDYQIAGASPEMLVNVKKELYPQNQLQALLEEAF